MKEKLLDKIAEEIGIGIHTGLRKWSEHPKSSVAWKAISDMDESWDYIVKEVAREVIKIVKRNIKK